jgi:hypothetical protein
MAYAFQDDIIGMPPMRTVDAAPRLPIGMLGHAVDPVLGGGEFLYLPGVANTVAGSLVTYNQVSPGSTTLAATGATGAQSVAVAMAAIGATQFGWYQVSGQAIIAKTTGAGITLGAALGVTATPGAVASATVAAAGSLDSVKCAVTAASADTTVAAQISRPMLN